MNQGFTLVELVVVTAIIVLITALTLPNYQLGDQQLALQRTAHKLAQDLRRTQEMAVSSREFADEVPGAYGLFLDKDLPTQYLIFADLDGDRAYSGADGLVEQISLEKEIQIQDISPIAPNNSLTVVFVPPDPLTVFVPDATSASIILASPSQQKTVQVNQVGLIAVE